MDHWRYYLRGRVLELFGFKQEAIAAYAAAVQAAPGIANQPARLFGVEAQQVHDDLLEPLSIARRVERHP